MLTSPTPAAFRSQRSDRFLFDFPIGLFASVMTFAGLARALDLSEAFFHLDVPLGRWIGIFAILLFVVLIVMFLAKLLLYPQKVKEEILDPADSGFFATIPIGLLLLSEVILPYYYTLYYMIWLCGAATMLIMTLVILLIIRKVQPHRSAMMLPCGMFVIAVTGGSIQFPWAEAISAGSFGAGIVLTLVWSVVLLRRGFTRTTDVLSLLMIGPFVLGFLAWTEMHTPITLFGAFVYYGSLLLFVILSAGILRHRQPFAFAWWSAAFLVAALTISSLRFAMQRPQPINTAVAGLLMLVLAALATYLLFKSVYWLIRGRLQSAN